VRPGGDSRSWWWLWIASVTVILAGCASPPGGRVIPAPGPGAPGSRDAGAGHDGATAAVPAVASPDTLVLVVFQRSAPDTACFRHAGAWQKPEESLLAEPARLYDVLGLFKWSTRGAPAARAAGDEIQRRLGLDAIDVDRGEVHLRKDYGRRLSLVTTTGLGAAAEDALEADYRLHGRWYVRSETRERGETFMELRREISFW
jgi:hypothetical protein